MPKHDIPDGEDAETNLIDFRDYLRPRGGRAVGQAGDAASDPEGSDWDVYRHAEYGDGRRPRLGRFDLIWVAMILAIGWIVWEMCLR